jgi:hypothetical protein
LQAVYQPSGLDRLDPTLTHGECADHQFNCVIGQYGGLVALVHVLHKSGFLEKLTSRVLPALPARPGSSR